MGCCGTEEKKDGACCSTDKKGCCGMKMCKNVGSFDRLLRVGIGSVLVTLTVVGEIGVWGWLGAVLILSGLIGWCGCYTLLGMNTDCCRKKGDGEKSAGSCCGGGGQGHHHGHDTTTPPAA